nr:MAG TPA: hypothetical protein [Crassvirales sp.]
MTLIRLNLKILVELLLRELGTAYLEMNRLEYLGM